MQGQVQRGIKWNTNVVSSEYQLMFLERQTVNVRILLIFHHNQKMHNYIIKVYTTTVFCVIYTMSISIPYLYIYIYTIKFLVISKVTICELIYT
jgi:hypothetical protein